MKWDNSFNGIEYYSNVKSSSVEWIWYPYIPCGKITVLQGDPGEGKAAFLFLKCERPFDFNFFLGNDLPGRICERHRTASLYSFSITESSDRSQRIFGKMILIRPMINARLA